MDSGNLSNPAVVAGILVGLAGLILVVGLAIQAWANRRNPPVSSAPEPQAGTPADSPQAGTPADSPQAVWSQASTPGDPTVQEPSTAELEAVAQGQAPVQSQAHPHSQAPVEGEVQPLEALAFRADVIKHLREDSARIRSESERMLIGALQLEIKAAFEQIRSARDEAVAAAVDDLRKAAEARAAFDSSAAKTRVALYREGQSARAELAKTGEAAAERVQQAHRKAEAALAGQEKRASEKLSRKAMRRERAARRRGEQPAISEAPAPPAPQQAEVPTAAGSAPPVPAQAEWAPQAAAPVELAPPVPAPAESAPQVPAQAEWAPPVAAQPDSAARAHREAAERIRVLEAQLAKEREDRETVIKDLHERIRQAEARADAAVRRAAAIEKLADLKAQEAKREHHLREVVASVGQLAINGGPAPARPLAPEPSPAGNGSQAPSSGESDSVPSAAPAPVPDDA